MICCRTALRRANCKGLLSQGQETTHADECAPNSPPLRLDQRPGLTLPLSRIPPLKRSVYGGSPATRELRSGARARCGAAAFRFFQSNSALGEGRWGAEGC